MQAIIPMGGSQVLEAPPVARVTSHKDMAQTIQAALPMDRFYNKNQSLFTHRDGFAWKGPKLYVPQVVCVKVLRCCHDVHSAGHFGFVKTLHLTNWQFWWPQMKKDIEEYVKSCTVCATMKGQPGKPLGLLQPVADPVQPWDQVAMDFIVGLPES